MDTIEEATTAVLTLSEGLEQTELLSSRLTKHELRRQLLSICDALASLTVEARGAMEELDLEGWAIAGERIRAGGASEANAAWLAIRAMAPATLGWLRLYKRQRPELFSSPEDSPREPLS